MNVRNEQKKLKSYENRKKREKKLIFFGLKTIAAYTPIKSQKDGQFPSSITFCMENSFIDELKIFWT